MRRRTFLLLIVAYLCAFQLTNAQEYLSVIEEGICKGGSWKQYEEEIAFDTNDNLLQPNAWTGFRNICYLVKIVPFE